MLQQGKIELEPRYVGIGLCSLVVFWRFLPGPHSKLDQKHPHASVTGLSLSTAEWEQADYNGAYGGQGGAIARMHFFLITSLLGTRAVH